MMDSPPRPEGEGPSRRPSHRSPTPMGAPLWGQVCTTALTSALASAEFETHLCMNLDWTIGNGVVCSSTVSDFCCFFLTLIFFYCEPLPQKTNQILPFFGVRQASPCPRRSASTVCTMRRRVGRLPPAPRQISIHVTIAAVSISVSPESPSPVLLARRFR